jgi:hypothetical protein
MCIITHDYLTYINSKLLKFIKNRSSFERVIACLLQINAKNNSLLGNIHKYMPWGNYF